MYVIWRKDACISVFIAILFSIAKTWKQPICQLTGMDKEDIVHIYNGKLFNHKKNVVMPFAATCMDLDNIILSEVSQRKTNI